MDLSKESVELPSPSSEGGGQFRQDPIAIIGLACRLPGKVSSPQALWELLERGGIASTDVPESRFNLQGHYDGSKKPGTMRSPGGMFLDGVDLETFDAAFFRISRAEAVSMDPNQRQLLEVIYEGLENAGVSLESLEGKPIGCFTASYATGDRDPQDRPSSIEAGLGRAFLSNRISHFLDLKGPSATIDTACSGSLVGLDMACRYLQNGEIESAIVAASNLYLSPEHVMDTGPIGQAHSPTGRCHTFDAKADGYIKAEAVSAVILKRLDDALESRDPIRAVIRGSATNSNGRTTGITSPDSAAQAAVARTAYASAGLSSLADTAYVELHGTGTPVGDPVEVTGVSSVFAGSRSGSQPLMIGSVKSNIGHSESAAGLSGLIKATLAIEHGVIPGNPTFLTPNPKIDFEALRVSATRTSTPWPKSTFRRASINSFGYGGSNAHVVLDELKSLCPELAPPHVSSFLSHDDDMPDVEHSGRPYTLLFSANDANSLQACAGALDRHVSRLDVRVKLRDLAYTLSERRSHHFHRGFIVARDTRIDAISLTCGKKAGERPRIGFVFTGQGAQWVQMGKAVVDAFPGDALPLLARLDAVLQSLPAPPAWTLVSELTEIRTAEHLRQPEFSQPLVTALQLVLVNVLSRWGVEPQSVVGHSSGELAAAYAAGYISDENAIKAAFYRGRCAKDCRKHGEVVVGMMAVGLGVDDIGEYLSDVGNQVQIACYNSPKSVTLSGATLQLGKIRERLIGDGHFARMLLVDLAYHSDFMADIGEDYERILGEQYRANDSKTNDVKMYSSVHGQEISSPVDALYWKTNMVSPVRFSDACREMVVGRNGADFLIEIGPSGALAGPISQIKEVLGPEASKLSYAATLGRGVESIDSIFAVAGKLFIAGASINFAEVHNEQDNALTPPSVIVDLPNYAWNHSNKYWHESQASKDWRFKLFPEHDLLGSKVLASPWQSPSFRKTLLLDRVPWLRDHQMGTDTILPASGFIAMAIEAMYQTAVAQGLQSIDLPVDALQYRLRNVKFDKALVLEEGVAAKVLLSTNPLAGTKDTWYEFRISSSTNDASTTHSTGLVRVDPTSVKTATSQDLSPLMHPTPARLWYKAQSEAGYGFGPAFRRTLLVEALAGHRDGRCTTTLVEPESAHTPQSLYAMHPACMDGCFQTVTPSLWAGERPSIDAVLLPATMDDLVIYPKIPNVDEGLSLASSKFTGRGRIEEAKSFLSNCSVFDPMSGRSLLKMQGLRYHKLDTGRNDHSDHTYIQTIWKPDITFLSQDQLHTMAQQDPVSGVQTLIDLVAHKKPAIKVLEVTLVAGDVSSLWFSADSMVIRSGYLQYSFISSDAKALITAKEDHQSKKRASFDLMDTSKGIALPKAGYDFAIIKVPELCLETATTVSSYITPSLAPGAFVLLLESFSETATSASDDGSETSAIMVNARAFSCESSPDDPAVLSTLANGGLDNVFKIPQEWAPNAYLGRTTKGDVVHINVPCVDVVHLSKRGWLSSSLKDALRQAGWQVTEHFYPYHNLQPQSLILVQDEITNSLLRNISEEQWESLQKILPLGSRLLWVTEGSQMNVTKPDNALVHGMFRTIRAEDRAAELVTLDVEYGQSPSTYLAIVKVLSLLLTTPGRTQVDSEYVERGGALYVSRLVPDELVSQAGGHHGSGGIPTTQNLAKVQSVARLQAERLGTLESLIYSQLTSDEVAVLNGHIEVDIKAAGLNFKDVAVTMGIVPENEHLLGHECAGVVRRVGRGADRFRVGDRVALLKSGTFANRIQCPTERAHLLPANMSFRDGATIPVAYLTSMYSLFDVGGLTKGQTILIHSAAGGVGLSAIQLAQWVGAEIYVTVGSQEKRDFLHSGFGIPYERMYSSRTSDFGPKILQATNGKGIDVILNSLTGELLDASWRVCADGGRMVEIGKKDIINRNFLSMEPFDRNCSFHGVDFSYSQHIKDDLISDLLDRTFKLVSDGHLKPIHPTTVYSFADVPSAFALMRSGRHIGKIVISDSEDAAVNVSIRPPPRVVKLEGEASYIIVGGLKGLCGSLAVYLAKHGARHIVAMSRSGCADNRSQKVISDCQALGCEIQGLQADVTDLVQVKRALQGTKFPVAGIIQGAMSIRDRPYEMMTISDFRTTLSSKVAGTWNLHKASLELKRPLSFFTLLSSISGVIGQKGQANYSAASVFLDAFSSYRLGKGLPANCVDLGGVEDVGYVTERGDMQSRLNDRQWVGISERVLHRILELSILQQTDVIHPASAAQLIAGLRAPQPTGSELAHDARFSSLFRPEGEDQGVTSVANSAEREVQALLLLHTSGAGMAPMVEAAVTAVGGKLERALRMSEPAEPSKSLSAYGLDSLSAVELRNWVRGEIGVEVTVLDITSASSLTSLCDKIVGRLRS